MLQKNRTVLDKLKDALIEKETLEEDEAAEIMAEAILPVEAKLH